MIFEHKTLTYKGKVMFEKLILGDFKRLPKVFQETEACFMFIEKGSFQFRTPEKVIHFSSGDGMLAKCGNYFFERALGQQQITEEKTKVIGAYFYPIIVKELLNYDLSLSDFEADYDTTKVNIDEILLNFIRSIEFLLDNPSVASDSMLMTKLKEFLLLLAKTESAPSVLDFVSSLYKPYEYNFKTTIENNLFASLSLNEIATLCGMSISTFQRKFAKIYSDSPAKYILHKKMEKAKELLSNKNLRISNVAYDCGFDAISTFNRSFKKQFGISPSQFRLNENE